MYVALSRARSMEGLCVRNLASSGIKTSAAAAGFYARWGLAGGGGGASQGWRVAALACVAALLPPMSDHQPALPCPECTLHGHALPRCRGGTLLPPHKLLRFPIRADMPPEFYQALEEGQPLALDQVPRLAAGAAAAAAAGPAPQQGDWQRQSLATPAVRRGGVLAAPDGTAGAVPPAPAPAAAPLPSLVPVSLQLAGECADGGGGGSSGSRHPGEVVVLGRAHLRQQAADVAGLLRLLCALLEAPPGDQVRAGRGRGLLLSTLSVLLTCRRVSRIPRRDRCTASVLLSYPAMQVDLYCTTQAGGPLLRVAAAAVQVGELLSGAHSLVLRQRRTQQAPAGA